METRDAILHKFLVFLVCSGFLLNRCLLCSEITIVYPKGKNATRICEDVDANSTVQLSCPPETWFHVIQKLASENAFGSGNNCSTFYFPNKTRTLSFSADSPPLKTECRGPSRVVSGSGEQLCNESVQVPGTLDASQIQFFEAAYECLNDSKMFNMCDNLYATIPTASSAAGDLYLASPSFFSQGTPDRSCTCTLTTENAFIAKALYLSLLSDDTDNWNFTCQECGFNFQYSKDPTVNEVLFQTVGQGTKYSLQIDFRPSRPESDGGVNELWISFKGGSAGINLACNEDFPTTTTTPTSTTTTASSSQGTTTSASSTTISNPAVTENTTIQSNDTLPTTVTAKPGTENSTQQTNSTPSASSATVAVTENTTIQSNDTLPTTVTAKPGTENSTQQTEAQGIAATTKTMDTNGTTNMSTVETTEASTTEIMDTVMTTSPSIAETSSSAINDTVTATQKTSTTPDVTAVSTDGIMMNSTQITASATEGSLTPPPPPTLINNATTTTATSTSSTGANATETTTVPSINGTTAEVTTTVSGLPVERNVTTDTDNTTVTSSPPPSTTLVNTTAITTATSKTESPDDSSTTQESPATSTNVLTTQLRTTSDNKPTTQTTFPTSAKPTTTAVLTTSDNRPPPQTTLTTADNKPTTQTALTTSESKPTTQDILTSNTYSSPLPTTANDGRGTVVETSPAVTEAESNTTVVGATRNKAKGFDERNIYIIVGVIVAVLVLLVVTGFFACRRRRRMLATTNTERKQFFFPSDSDSEVGVSGRISSLYSEIDLNDNNNDETLVSPYSKGESSSQGKKGFHDNPQSSSSSSSSGQSENLAMATLTKPAKSSLKKDTLNGRGLMANLNPNLESIMESSTDDVDGAQIVAKGGNSSEENVYFILEPEPEIKKKRGVLFLMDKNGRDLLRDMDGNIIGLDDDDESDDVSKPSQRLATHHVNEYPRGAPGDEYTDVDDDVAEENDVTNDASGSGQTSQADVTPPRLSFHEYSEIDSPADGSAPETQGKQKSSQPRSSSSASDGLYEDVDFKPDDDVIMVPGDDKVFARNNSSNKALGNKAANPTALESKGANRSTAAKDKDDFMIDNPVFVSSITVGGSPPKSIGTQQTQPRTQRDADNDDFMIDNVAYESADSLGLTSHAGPPQQRDGGFMMDNAAYESADSLGLMPQASNGQTEGKKSSVNPKGAVDVSDRQQADESADKEGDRYVKIKDIQEAKRASGSLNESTQDRQEANSHDNRHPGSSNQPLQPNHDKLVADINGTRDESSTDVEDVRSVVGPQENAETLEILVENEETTQL